MFERDTGCPSPQSNGYPRETVKRDRLHPRVRPGPPVVQPASSAEPKHPDPQSQSLSRSYGSNLPTSLTYIVQLPEAVHLGDLMRIWVRPATKIIMPRSDFQGPTRAFRTPQDGWCFTKASPLSPDNPIPGGGCASNKEERTLPRTLADVSEVGCVTALSTNRRMYQSPWTGSGILTRFPFATGGYHIHTC